MVFKLVRVDTEESNKIELSVGTHLIGRGSCLDCTDKRISRNHGHLVVTEDSLVIEALHQNPCFFTKKGTKEIEVLKKSSKETLQNGDRFGLLPGNYWYEVLLCLPETDSQATDVSSTQELVNGEMRETNHESSKQNDDYNSKPDDCESKPNDENDQAKAQEVGQNETVQDRDESKVNSSTDVGFEENSELLDFDLNETIENVRAESPSLLAKENQDEAKGHQTTPNPDTSPNVTIEEPILDEPQPNTADAEPDQRPQSPSPKRGHSPDGDDEGAKKIKTEPVDVKVEPGVKQEPDVRAGPSNDQAGASNSAADTAKAPPSPAKPPNRERCLYGANCYRRNPQHKAQFSHPSDADWGSGERGACPYGASCRRRDPRHWQTHEHPPHTHPPPPAGARVVERRGNIFYINAQSINFYDDHFQVEDSEGDSVDFDYEF